MPLGGIKLIVVRIWEGLGNQMFQYAYARVLQEKTGQTVKLDTQKIFEHIYTLHNIHRENGLFHFNISLKEASSKDLKMYDFMERKNLYQKLKYILAGKGIGRGKVFIEKKHTDNQNVLCLHKNTYVIGWFQNPDIFNAYRNILLREFTPVNSIRIPHALKELLDDNEVISIHIRKGDYKKAGNVLPVSYYKKAIDFIQANINTAPVFLLFSDEKISEKDFPFIKGSVIPICNFGEFEDYQELLIMSRCKHNIIANSTFSWWAAWLNRNPDKIVVAPAKWFLKSVNKDYKIVPNEWHKI